MVAAFAGHTHQVHMAFLRTCYCTAMGCKQVLSVTMEMWLDTQDGYGRDQTGIHYRALGAILETPPGRDCFGFIGKLERCTI